MNRYYVIQAYDNGEIVYFNGLKWSYNPKKYMHLSDCDSDIKKAKAISKNIMLKNIRVVGIK